MTLKQNNYSKWRMFIAWLLVTAFLILDTFSQTSGNILATQVKQSFNISLGELGFLNSAFFWSYMLIQVPSGLFFDNCSLRTTLIGAAILFTFGSIGFAYTKIYFAAFIYRALMGCGAGFGFVGLVYVLKNMFEAKSLHFFLGISVFCGMFTSAVLQREVPHVIVAGGWRVVLYAMGGFSALTGVLALWFLPKSKPTDNKLTCKSLWQKLKKTISLKEVWLLGLFCFSSFSIFTVVVDLWGTLFLEHLYNLSYIQAASSLTWLILGLAFGGPLLGWFSRKTGHQKELMLCGMMAGIVIVLIITFFNSMDLNLLRMCLFLLGAVCSLNLLGYSLVGTLVTNDIVGVSVGFANTIALLAAITFQPLLGFSLTYLQQLNIPSKLTYQLAMLYMPIMFMVGFVAIFWLRIIEREKNYLAI